MNHRLFPPPPRRAPNRRNSAVEGLVGRVSQPPLRYLERFHRECSGCHGHARVAMQQFRGETCPRQAWAWHPTRYTELECALMIRCDVIHILSQHRLPRLFHRLGMSDLRRERIGGRRRRGRLGVGGRSFALVYQPDAGSVFGSLRGTFTASGGNVVGRLDAGWIGASAAVSIGGSLSRTW